MFRRPAHFCSLPIPLTIFVCKNAINDFVSGMGKGKKRRVVYLNIVIRPKTGRIGFLY